MNKITNKLFYECKSLKLLNIPKSVSSIKDFAFYGCASLEEIAIHENIISIEDFAFYGCASLQKLSISNGLQKIGISAFCECSSLDSISIPSSVISIGQCAFCDCSNVSSINVSKENKVYDSRENCNAIVLTKENKIILGCKNTKFLESASSIGSKAFYGFVGLTKLIIPDSINSFSVDSFANCENLSTIIVSQIDSTWIQGTIVMQ